jgi:hypothetical protein
VIAAVALPMLSVQGIDTFSDGQIDRAGVVLQQASFAAPFFPILALCVGAFLAVATWLPDIAGRWVYVLTLPVDRVKLAAMRFATGMVLILPVGVALWISALFAVSMAGIEAPVVAAPGALALRFTVAALLAFVVVSPVVHFKRHTWIILAALVFLSFVFTTRIPGVPALLDLLFLHDMSPLHPLAGEWRLFDV